MNHNQTNSEENDYHIRELKQKINIFLELEQEKLIQKEMINQVVCEI